MNNIDFICTTYMYMYNKTKKFKMKYKMKLELRCMLPDKLRAKQVDTTVAVTMWINTSESDPRSY